MRVPIRPLHEITDQAISMLAREIGIQDTVRFVNQFTSGCGNYTDERGQLFADLALEEILAEISHARSGDQAG
jgi:hypothetical protein